MTDGKKPGVVFWVTVALIVAFVGYPLSFGPACWLTERDPMTYDRIAPRIFWPIGWICVRGPGAVRKAISWYATLDGNSYVLLLPAEPSGSMVVGVSR